MSWTMISTGLTTGSTARRTKPACKAHSAAACKPITLDTIRTRRFMFGGVPHARRVALGGMGRLALAEVIV